MSTEKSAVQIEAERDKDQPIFYVDGVPVYCHVNYIEFLRNFTNGRVATARIDHKADLRRNRSASE